MWLASPDSRVSPSLLSLSHNGTPYPRRIQVLGWFHVAAGYHIVGDYAVGEHLDNNPLVNLTQMPMGASAVGVCRSPMGWVDGSRPMNESSGR